MRVPLKVDGDERESAAASIASAIAAIYAKAGHPPADPDPPRRARHAPGPGRRRLAGALLKAGIVPPRKPDDKRWPPPGHGMHVLRHTAASAWLWAGKSPAAVAARLGDTVETVLAIYAHLMPGDDDSGRPAMDAFFTASALDVPSAAKR